MGDKEVMEEPRSDSPVLPPGAVFPPTPLERTQNRDDSLWWPFHPPMLSFHPSMLYVSPWVRIEMPGMFSSRLDREGVILNPPEGLMYNITLHNAKLPYLVVIRYFDGNYECLGKCLLHPKTESWLRMIGEGTHPVNPAERPHEMTIPLRLSCDGTALRDISQVEFQFRTDAYIPNGYPSKINSITDTFLLTIKPANP